MTGNENFTKDTSHSGGSSIDLDKLEPTTSSCCGGHCSRTCGCGCDACAGRMNIPKARENSSNYTGQGGYDHGPVEAHATTITPAMNSLTTRDSFQDFATIGNNSYDAPLPIASPLTRTNIEQLNQQSGGRYSHAQWLAQHYEDVDQNPDEWFNSPSDDEVFDAAGAIEGEGMEESARSLHVGHESMSQSATMLSQYTSSFSRTSGSPGMFLPEMRRNLVHRPLSLVPECQPVAANYFHNHDTQPPGSG